MDAHKLQRNIMRRVYYAFGLSIVSHTMFWQGMFLSVAAALLAHWLHVASIINNVLAVPVGQTPHYVLGSVFGALTHGEVLTVLTLLAAGAIGLASLWRLGRALTLQHPVSFG